MSKTSKHRVFLLASALLLNMLLPLQVRADGGAPNLAYVAGAAQGIGIIDVAQRKVATKFTIAGNPFSILLSPDGRLLYVTQPAPGRVAVLAAKTGQTICTAPFEKWVSHETARGCRRRRRSCVAMPIAMSAIAISAIAI